MKLFGDFTKEHEDILLTSEFYEPINARIAAVDFASSGILVYSSTSYNMYSGEAFPDRTLYDIGRTFRYYNDVKATYNQKQYGSLETLMDSLEKQWSDSKLYHGIECSSGKNRTMKFTVNKSNGNKVYVHCGHIGIYYNCFELQYALTSVANAQLKVYIGENHTVEIDGDPHVYQLKDHADMELLYNAANVNYNLNGI